VIGYWSRAFIGWVACFRAQQWLRTWLLTRRGAMLVRRANLAAVRAGRAVNAACRSAFFRAPPWNSLSISAAVRDPRGGDPRAIIPARLSR
jgi:hypothetical protein